MNRDGRFYAWFRGSDSLLSQAQRQLDAAGGTPIRWSVAEEKAVGAIKELFMREGIRGIEVVHVPAL